MGLSYKDSGVDIEKGERFVDLIKGKLKRGEKENIGLFGALFELDWKSYKNPVLVSSTDGVGTKLLLAKAAKNYRSIGIDLVAMCVNDVITLGARPLFFLDYLACGNLDVQYGSEVIDGIIEGCRHAGCALLGGETAEMPGVYAPGDYELAGFSVGIVEKSEIIDGKKICEGDVLVGIRSSGIHSNGLSLARNALFKQKGYTLNERIPRLRGTLGEELLIPTRVYTDIVLDMIGSVPVKGIAHITGGGIAGNVRRLLPDGLGLRIWWDALEPVPIFEIIQHAGNISEEEMRKTFNLGIGMVFVTDKNRRDILCERLRSRGEDPLLIGDVVATSI
jgi:phosphoribosylformylglycinamidine cyclo-ligase